MMEVGSHQNKNLYKQNQIQFATAQDALNIFIQLKIRTQWITQFQILELIMMSKALLFMQQVPKNLSTPNGKQQNGMIYQSLKNSSWHKNKKIKVSHKLRLKMIHNVVVLGVLSISSHMQMIIQKIILFQILELIKIS